MQTQKLFIEGQEGALEAEIFLAESRSEFAIVCHPHPLYQGTMHNKVVTTLFKAIGQKNISVVRFNFRGVGQSAGTYGDIVGEINDMLHVIQFLDNQYNSPQLILAGFSFGAYIAAHCATLYLKRCRALITIAPAVGRAPFETLQNITAPWLVVSAKEDEVVDSQTIKQFVESREESLTFTEFEETSHFFHGKLTRLKEHVLAFLDQVP